MEGERSSTGIDEEALKSQVDSAPSDIDRINIILLLVHKGKTLPKEILEKGLDLCTENAFFVAAGRLALLVNKRDVALDSFLRAITQYKTRGGIREAIEIAQFMKKKGLIKDDRIERGIILSWELANL